MTLADAPHQGGPAPGVATVTGRGRSAADVAAQLMDVLADEPRVAECDLAAMAAEGTATAGAFQRVDEYLRHWPAPVVLVHAPDPSLQAGLRSVASTDRLLIHSSWQAADEHRVLPHRQRQSRRLSPVSTAPREARTFVTRALLDWQLPRLVGPASQVVSELANSALTEQPTTMELTVSTVDEQVRIAVRDDGPSPGAVLDGVPASPFNGAGLQLVQAFAQRWDVIPAPAGGKTVWTILHGTWADHGDSASRERSLNRGRHAVGTRQRPRARRLGRGMGRVVPMWPRPSRSNAEST